MSMASGEPRQITLDDVPGLLLPDETVGTASAVLKPLRCRLGSRLSIVSDESIGVTFSVEADSEVSVRAFNAPTDHDPDLVLVPPDAGQPGHRDGQIELTPGLCWLKVQHRAQVGLEEGMSLAGARSHLHAEAPVTFSDYRLHDAGENAAHAVTSDLLNPRFAQRLEDVQALRAREALAFQASGTLRARAEVSWSEVLAGGLGALAGIVGAAAPLSVEVPAAASVSGTVTLGDEFAVIFSRLSDGCTRVTVRKAASRTFEGAADLGLSVELADPQQLELAVREALTGLLGEDYATVRSLIEKASLSELSEAERWAAEALAARLGLAEVVGAFAGLRDKLRQIDGAIAEAIAELAAEKLSVGFEYEYSRLASGASLLEVVLDAGSLATYHASLCNGDLEPILGAVLQGQAGVKLEGYLHRRTLGRDEGWGFTLGLGPWAARGRQRRALTRVIDEDVAGRLKVSCVGLGAYEGRWLTSVAEWTVDLKADMRRFGPAGALHMSQFSIGFHLAWHWRQEVLSEDRLDEVLDAAVLWGVLDLTHATDLRRRLTAAVGRASDLTAQMRLDDRSFRAVLPALAAGRDADFAFALGAAMPRRTGSQGRGDPGRRRELYGPLWAHVLENPDAPARALVTLARQHLTKAEEPQLGFLEENYLKLAPTCTFVGLARVANQNTAAAWHDFRSGARLLHDAVSADAEENGTLDQVFSLMVNLWLQTHHVRALGAFMLEAAMTAGVAEGVTRTLRVNTRGAGGESTLVVAVPAT
ncbi:MAG TPA: hypothetical protein VMT45_10510 [Thermoanaerobaculaceae bacterium]|nr:hypothetical protein [Thermoanaerobaculaceae bacterium]